MQHEPPTTDRDTLSAGQGETLSTPETGQATLADGEPQIEQTEQTEQLAHQESGMPEAAYTPENTSRENVSGHGYIPDAIANDVPGVPYSGTEQLAGKKEGSLSDYTMQQLQLRSQPFMGTSAEGELFADEVTFSQINDIKQAIIKGDTVLLLTGEEGSGKTTLLKQLTRNSGARLQFFSVKGGEKYTTHNLFSGILHVWKLTPPSNYEDSAKEMLLALQANHERNTTVVLLLDDSDLVPPKELHLLLATIQYFNSDEPLLRVIMSATPEFESRLPQLLPQGLKLPYSAMQVEPLLASRAAPYIQLRLNQAGHFDEFPLSEKQVSSIANDASGYPGRINFLAAETLNQIFSPFTDSDTSAPDKKGFFAKLQAGKSRKAGKALLALLGIGLIGAGVYKTVIQDNLTSTNTDSNAANSTATQQNGNSEFTTVETRPITGNSNSSGSESSSASPTVTNSVSATSGNDSNSEPAVALEPVSSTTTPAANGAGNTTAQQTGADSTANTTSSREESASAELKAAANELSVALGTSSETNSAEAVAEDKPAENVAADTNNNPAVNTDDSRAENTAASNTTDNSDATARQTESGNLTAAELPNQASESATPTGTNEARGANEDSDAEVPLAAPETPRDTTQTTAEEPATDTTTTSESDAAEETTQTAASSSEAADVNSANQTESASVNSLESPNWVLLQNADLWTIQLSASTDKKDIDRFLRNAGLEGPTSIYSFKRGEVTWYALVQGLYDGVGEAREAIAGMNSNAVKNQPWIRKIGSIQESLTK